MTVLGDSGAQPSVVGRYELRGTLGIGGFATVYRAYDTALDGEVALKVLLPQFADNADVVGRFLQEARLLRRVESANVVRIYDIGELDDGRPFFVMEFAAGGVLSSRIGGGAGRESLTRVVDALATGLGALHAAGIVHRDIKPDNLLITGSANSGDTQIRVSLLAEDERIVIGDLGLAKDQDRTSAGPTIAGGTPFFRSPEQMELGAEITPAADIYAATGVLWNLLTGSYPPNPSEVAGQLPSLPAAWQPVLERGLQRDPTLRYATMTEWAEDARTAIGFSPETGVISAAVGESGSLCPYKGMAAFQAEDAGLFFGRDDLVDTLVGRIQDHPVLVIGGPSGSGKSSLLRAGLLPRLARGAIAGSQQWNVALFNPGTDAIGELLHQLRRLRPDAAHPPTREDLPQGARRWLDDDGPPTLLAIDQFEELFTLNPSADDRQLFLDTLAAMTQSAHSRIKVAVALRADFYGSCATHPWLAERINEAQVLVGPMDRKELREAIVAPAQRAGLALEDGLADLILEDVGSGAGALPLLGHALMETWLRRRGSTLTVEGYRAAGGVSGAIAQRAEDVCSGFDTTEQDAARRLLLRLTNPGEGTPDTRRRISLASLDTDPELVPVSEKLASARLLTVDDGTIEVAHEALLHSWPRLRGWIEDDRENLHTRRRITAAAKEWEAQERSADLLYRGTPLEGALEWQERHPRDLEPTAHMFLQSAREVRDAEIDAQQQARRKSRRTRRLAVGALGALTAAALVASVVAFGALQRSQENEEEARAQQVQALAAAATGNAPTQPLLATALAVESIVRADPSTAAARDALVESRAGIDANRWQPQPFGSPVTVGDMISVAIDRTGDRFFTGSRTGDIVVWDRATRTRIDTFSGGPQGHDAGVEGFDISPDGRWLVSGGGSRVFLWDLSATAMEPQLVAEIDNGDARIWDIAFSPDGNHIAVATESDGLPVFERSSGALAGPTFREEAVDVLSVAFLTNSRVVLGDGSGRLWTVDALTGQTVPADVDPQTLPIAGVDDNDVWELLVNAERTLLFTSSDDNTTRTFAIQDGTVAREPMATMDALDSPRGIVLTRDDQELVAGEQSGRTWRIDPMTGSLIEDGMSTTAHADRVTESAISDNGWMVTLGDDQAVQVWRYIGQLFPAGAELAQMGDPATGVALSPTADRVAVSTAQETVVLDAETGDIIRSLPGPTLDVAFVDDDRLLTSAADGTIRAWSISGGTVLAEATAHGGSPIWALVASPDLSQVASVGNDGSVILWSSDTFAMIAELTRHNSAAYSVQFFPDGNRVASVGFDGIRVSSTSGGDSRFIDTALDGPRAIAVHPDGELLAVGGGVDETVHIIDLSGQVLQSMSPHPGGVWDATFTSDGLSMAASSLDGDVQLWDWATAERLGPAFVFHDRPMGVSTGPALIAGPTGTVWTVGGDGAVRKLDALDQGVACEISMNVINEPMRERFLGADPLQGCSG